MVNKGLFFVIVFIALIACIAIPVDAYSTYETSWQAGRLLHITNGTQIPQLSCDNVCLDSTDPTQTGCYLTNPAHWAVVSGSSTGYNIHPWHVERNILVDHEGNATPLTVSESDYGKYFFQESVCSPSGSNQAGVYYLVGDHNDLIVAPVASFTCTPTSQYPGEGVVCTDTSTNTPTEWLWTIDAESWGYDGWQTHTGQDFTWYSLYPGIFSVNLRANNSAGYDWENKTNYVSISVNATPNNCDIQPASGYIRTYTQTNDGMTSGGISGSDIQMHDMEGGAWSNITGSQGWWCIDTLPGHHLNLYAQASGYSDVESLGVSANGGRHYLVMWPDYIPAPSAGNVTLYALVYDQQTGAPLYLSSVRVDGNTINTILKNTGPEGQAIFTIKNDTSIHVTASKSGYSTITKVLTTSHLGPDTVMISLPRVSTTATATATATPSWMTPSTTIDPRTSMQKDEDMMNLIRDNGSALIGLAIITTMLGLMKMWGK